MHGHSHEPYKDTHSVLDAALGILDQLAHDLPDHRVGRFLLIRPSHAPDQRRVVEPGQIQLPSRPFQSRIDLVRPFLADNPLLSRLDRVPGPSQLRPSLIPSRSRRLGRLVIVGGLVGRLDLEILLFRAVREETLTVYPDNPWPVHG
jgi:hypothetical protein